MSDGRRGQSFPRVCSPLNFSFIFIFIFLFEIFVHGTAQNSSAHGTGAGGVYAPGPGLTAE